MAWSMVKSRSRHDVVLLDPQTNIPIKYELPTTYGLQDMAWTRILRSRSLWHLVQVTASHYTFILAAESQVFKINNINFSRQPAHPGDM